MAITAVNPAFTLCTTGKCPGITREAPGGKERTRDHVALKTQPVTPACTGNCSCRIFMRKKGETGAWDPAFPDKDGDIDNNDDYDYEAACVTPVLPGSHTLCSATGCVSKPKKLKDSDDIWCPSLDTPCSAGCTCELFRLKRDSTGAWEHVAKAGKKEDPNHKKYYYECICVK